MKQQYAADQEVKVQVFLHSSAPLPLRLHKLDISFTDQVSWPHLQLIIIIMGVLSLKMAVTAHTMYTYRAELCGISMCISCVL